jgi:hypothetical protein
MKNTELTTVTTYQKPLSDPNPHSDPIPQSITKKSIQAYRRCLQLDIGDHTFGQDSPRTWAREDLRDIIEGGAKIKKVF